MPADQQRVQSIFLAAIEAADPASRAALLARECGDDAELRVRVETLLEAHEQPGSFLAEPAVALEAAADSGPPQTVNTATACVARVEGAGLVIGPYKLLQEIGEGGMGTVWMAEQTRPVQRKVALKIIKAGMDSRHVLARFDAERQALALMDHPHIAKVLDAGATPEGRPYFVMELVKGQPITTYCDNQRLTPKERLELFVPVCQAIQHAHQKGIIHRDIKPTNVLVAPYDGKPVVKVIDFGVAKATGPKLTDKTLFTEFGQVVGTLEYMSPEQAELNNQDIDTRSDIYSLGVLLYELLTGTTPLERKRLKEAAFVELLRVIREVEPPRPSTRLSDGRDSLPSVSAQRQTEPARLTKLVRGELDWIVMKALEKDRNRRYETANGFAMDVQRYLADEAVQACPPTASYRLRKFARRHKRSMLVALSILALLIVGIVGTTWGMMQALAERNQKELAPRQAKANAEAATYQRGVADENARQAETQRGLAIANEKTAKAQELLARRRFYAAQMNLAHEARERGEMGRLLELLEEVRPLSKQEDLRSFDWYYLWRVCHHGHMLTLRGHSGTVNSVAFSPDGKSLVSGGSDGATKLWDVSAGQVRRTFQGTWVVGGVTFGPGARTLASGDFNGMLRWWDIDGNPRELAAVKRRIMIRTLATSLDGKTMASGGGFGPITIWDMQARSEIASIKRENPPGALDLACLALSPDGKLLAAGWQDHMMKVWDLPQGKERFTLSSGVGQAAAFSPDGKVVASGDWDQVVHLWDTTTGKERASFRGHTDTVQCLAFSPDGKRLASGSWDRTVKIWDLATGSVQTYAHLRAIKAVAFSPDGKTLASASEDGSVKLWDCLAEPERGPIKSDTPFAVVFAPDDKTMATADWAGNIELWDVPMERIRMRLPATKFEVRTFSPQLAFSPDGKSLAAPGYGGTVKLWDVSSGKERKTFAGHQSTVIGVAYSPDGKVIASGGVDGDIILWDVASGKARAKLHAAETNFLFLSQVAFSPDGRTLATTAGSTFCLWDVDTGRERSRGRHPNTIYSLAFSPDGSLLACAGLAQTVTLWDNASGKQRGVINTRSATVRSIAWAAEGKTIAGRVSDGTVYLWDAATGQERGSLYPPHQKAGWAVALSHDGKTLVTGSDDGTVQFWHTATEEDVLAQSSRATSIELGDDYLGLGQYEKAVAEYSRAIELDAKNAAIWYRRAQANFRLKRFHNARGDYGKVLELVPASPSALNDLAWCLSTCPEVELRDRKQAVALAQQAVKLAGDQGPFWNTLGAAHYRAGDWKAAIEALERSMELRNGGDSLDWFFLAMAHWQLGNRNEARSWYDRAVPWMEQNQPNNEELVRFRAEAESLLGIKQ